MNESTNSAIIDTSQNDPKSIRIDRWRYLTRLCGIYLAIQLASLSAIVWLGEVIIGLCFYIHISIRRLNDLNLSGWFVLLLGLPLINFALLVLPGSSSTNRFGPPPQKMTKGEIAFTTVSILLTLSLFVVTYIYIVGPALERYRIASGL